MPEERWDSSVGYKKLLHNVLQSVYQSDPDLRRAIDRCLEDADCLQEAMENLNLALENISPRRAEAIRLHFGLNDDQPPLTLKEAGQLIMNEKTGRLGIDHERVRQLEVGGCRELRKQPEIETIKRKVIG